jgi:hypothetical protein
MWVSPNCHGLDHHLRSDAVEDKVRCHMTMWRDELQKTTKCLGGAPSGLGRGAFAPDAPYRLYRGRPVNPNSYFVDRARARFPQMDVWPSCRFGRHAGSHAVRKLIRPAPASQTPLCQASGDLRLLLTFTYHGCPRFLPVYYAGLPSSLHRRRRGRQMEKVNRFVV